MGSPRLVASDVDGTLLGPLEQVSERTGAAVRSVVGAGVPFVLVTGRPPRWIPQVTEALGVRGLTVCSNGAIVYDAHADRVVSASLLDAVTLHDVANVLRDILPGCRFAVERCMSSARDRVPEQALAEEGFGRNWPDGEITPAPLGELVGHDAVKLLVLHESMNSAQMAEAAGQVLGERVQITYSMGLGLLEISAPGVHKATGLAEVARELGVDAKDVLAFGDMPNDLPMLRWAGYGVAMANAHEDLFAVADEVTTAHSADGVARVLERWWAPAGPTAPVAG